MSNEHLEVQLQFVRLALQRRMGQIMEDNGIFIPENAPTTQEARTRWINTYAGIFTPPERRAEARLAILQLSHQLPPITSADTSDLQQIEDGKRYWIDDGLNILAQPNDLKTAKEIVQFLRSLQPKISTTENPTKNPKDVEWLKQLAEKETRWRSVLNNSFTDEVGQQHALEALEFIEEQKLDFI